ncbi:MAG TPA: hypothetical protein VHJ34_02995 [Actinomycetota bacterium]|nr:hypothetical protein [Actinomycetota bacterium]
MRRTVAAWWAALLTAASVLVAAPAAADHTNPREPQSPTTGSPADGVAAGEGTWTHLHHFQANPGTDLEFFRKAGRKWSSSGTLGQGDEGHVGQRILRLLNEDGKVRPRWYADHGSANCPTANPSGTLGLQHDVQVTPRKHPKLIVDTTDATGRCHDAEGGGLELVDITGLGRRAGFEPREIALTRHDGTSHNVTVDKTRPWVLYNSNTDTGRPWIDVIDIRSCLRGIGRLSVSGARDQCRPRVLRMPFEPEWTAQVNHDPNDGEVGEVDPSTATGCHDITAARGRIYCAAINGTAIFDVSDITADDGRVRGELLPCELVDGDGTGAKVTDCDLGAGNDSAAADVAAYDAAGRPQARGWRFLGSVNHPGREDANTNQYVTADEGVAVSHESDPVFGGDFMLVTDERGGGVQPPGASCTPGLENPIGNGGIHVFDVSDPANPEYALTPEGDKAVFISDQLSPMPTFCNVHVIEKIPGEQRLIVAWYSQGIKVVDYFVDGNGRWTFDEVASYQLPGANTWTVENFKIRRNDDGTRTYFFMASDIQRGIDIVKWRGPANVDGRRLLEARRTGASAGGDVALVAAALVLLPAGAVLGRRRRAPRAARP